MVKFLFLFYFLFFTFFPSSLFLNQVPLLTCPAQPFTSDVSAAHSLGLFTLKAYRVTEWLRFKGTSGGYLVHPTAKARLPTGHCTGLRPRGF